MKKSKEHYIIPCHVNRFERIIDDLLDPEFSFYKWFFDSKKEITKFCKLRKRLSKKCALCKLKQNKYKVTVQIEDINEKKIG